MQRQPRYLPIAQRNTSVLASVPPHHSPGIFGIIFDSDFYLRVVKSESAEDTSRW